MSSDYQPREHDHLVEPMIDAVRGEPTPKAPAVSRVTAWASLVVPLGGFVIAVLVWALYRLFS